MNSPNVNYKDNIITKYTDFQDYIPKSHILFVD